MTFNTEQTDVGSVTEMQSLLWRDLELSQQLQSILPERSEISRALRNFHPADVDVAVEGICEQLERMTWQDALAGFRASSNPTA